MNVDKRTRRRWDALAKAQALRGDHPALRYLTLLTRLASADLIMMGSENVPLPLVQDQRLWDLLEQGTRANLAYYAALAKAIQHAPDEDRSPFAEHFTQVRASVKELRTVCAQLGEWYVPERRAGSDVPDTCPF